MRFLVSADIKLKCHHCFAVSLSAYCISWCIPCNVERSFEYSDIFFAILPCLITGYIIVLALICYLFYHNSSGTCTVDAKHKLSLIMNWEINNLLLFIYVAFKKGVSNVSTLWQFTTWKFSEQRRLHFLSDTTSCRLFLS